MGSSILLSNSPQKQFCKQNHHSNSLVCFAKKLENIFQLWVQPSFFLFLGEGVWRADNLVSVPVMHISAVQSSSPIIFSKTIISSVNCCFIVEYDGEALWTADKSVSGPKRSYLLSKRLPCHIKQKKNNYCCINFLLIKKIEAVGTADVRVSGL